MTQCNTACEYLVLLWIFICDKKKMICSSTNWFWTELMFNCSRTEIYARMCVKDASKFQDLQFDSVLDGLKWTHFCFVLSFSLYFIMPLTTSTSLLLTLTNFRYTLIHPNAWDKIEYNHFFWLWYSQCRSGASLMYTIVHIKYLIFVSIWITALRLGITVKIRNLCYNETNWFL